MTIEINAAILKLLKQPNILFQMKKDAKKVESGGDGDASDERYFSDIKLHGVILECTKC